MKNYRQKLDQLKWLKLAGVDYYFNNQPAEEYLKRKDESFLDQVMQLKGALEFDQSKQLLETSKLAEVTEITKNSVGKLVDNNVLYSLEPALPKLKQEEIRREITLVANILSTSEGSENNNMIEKSRRLANEATTLEQLQEMVNSFDGCDLKNLAQNTVFSSGSTDAKVMLIGEAPGASEDAQGIPFCGESGKLLDKMLEAINLSREKNAYITNTVFWRPPANRRPTQEEIDICRPFVEKHIALLDPELIILVGATASTSLIGKHSGISNIRNNAFKYSNPYIKNPINMMAIFHPAYLLRQPMKKKDTWYDLIKIQQHIIENGIKL